MKSASGEKAREFDLRRIGRQYDDVLRAAASLGRPKPPARAGI
jgi:hypothetical protein